MATGRGAKVVQGSVSLNDKSALAGCTGLVKSFRKHVAAWWAGVHQRIAAAGKKLRIKGWVQGLKILYTTDDSDWYGQ